MTPPTIDFDRLLKLRLIVARFGEMDLAKWWNTRGQLGRFGSVTLRRGFPRTYHFAQAHSVFAVAAHRCREIFDLPESVTLWQLPESIESEFDTRWEFWLDHASEWTPFFESLETLKGTDLGGKLLASGLIFTEDMQILPRLRLTAEGRAVPLNLQFSGTNQDITLLALGFARSEPGKLAVPYAKRGVA
jgi:hypothetical protein